MTKLAVVCAAGLICIAGTYVYSQTAPPTKKMEPQAPAMKQMTDAEKVKSALAAAPMAVANGASVMDMPSMKVLKQGNNGWTCFPDTPSPGPDPMCVDKNGMEWVHAWMNKQPPPKDKMGFAYMLMGGSDATNTDPFATEPQPGTKWVDTGPHVMILNIGDHFAGYPTMPGDTKMPWVMFPGTPYAHLMIPVK